MSGAVEIKFIQSFCSWESAQWTNMKFPSEMKFMKIYSESKSEKSYFWGCREHRKILRVWFMWIWIKSFFKWSSLCSCARFSGEAIKNEWSRSRAALIYAPFVWNRCFLVFFSFTRLQFFVLLFPSRDILPTISFQNVFVFSSMFFYFFCFWSEKFRVWRVGNKELETCSFKGLVT